MNQPNPEQAGSDETVTHLISRRYILSLAIAAGAAGSMASIPAEAQDAQVAVSYTHLELALRLTSSCAAVRAREK